MQPLHLGIDVGTSGVRVAVIDAAGAQVAGHAVPMPAPHLVDGRPTQDPAIWWRAVSDCLDGLVAPLSAAGRQMGEIAALAVDATSGTMLLADRALEPLSPGLMYNSAGFAVESERIAAVAPAASMVQGPSSALARLLFLLNEHSPPPGAHLCHQADWIAGRLMGQAGFSDETNALKTGYDPRTGAWPDWFKAFGFAPGLLPQVLPVGALQGRIDASMASRFGLAAGTKIMAGTTDSVAAFLATGADRIGDAVTSLGTTLAIKLLCDRPISDAATGIYSHKVGARWLAGGASNSGGGVLLAHFSASDLDRLTPLLKPDEPTGLDYYPLNAAGERFPVNNPALAPRLEPRPDDDLTFFQAMLEGMAAIEAHGYRCLEALGGPAPRRIFTAGGGARNGAWTKIRQRHFACPIVAPRDTDAVIGAARIAAGRVDTV